MSFNNVLLLGRLGKDPEQSYTQGGLCVVKMSLATSRKAKDGTEKTQWHNIKVFGKLAETVSQYLHKGSECMLRGEINYNKYEDKAGNTKYFTEIIADTVRFVGGRPAQASNNQSGQGGEQVHGDFADDEIPF